MQTGTIFALAAVLAGSPALAAVTPISGGVAAETYASAGNGESFGTAAADGWTTLQPGTMFTASSSASAEFPGGITANPIFASAQMSVNATWASATAGTVNMSWSHLVTNMGTARAGVADREWYYQFSLSTPAELSLNWSGLSTLTAGISTFGLNNVIMLVDDGVNYPLQIPTGGNLDGPAGSGITTALLAPGNYLLTLSSPHGLNAGSTLGANAQLDIAWSIAPTGSGAVPEPASWAMLITGFGLVGGISRRRQAQLPRVTA
jgi:hypothetical protein